jgi:hypothetical protein
LDLNNLLDHFEASYTKRPVFSPPPLLKFYNTWQRMIRVKKNQKADGKWGQDIAQEYIENEARLISRRSMNFRS